MRLLNDDGRPYPIYPVFIVAHMIVLLQNLQVKPEKHEKMIWTKKTKQQRASKKQKEGSKMF